MDRNSITGIILIVIVMGTFTWWQSKNRPEPVGQNTEQTVDSILNAQLQQDSIEREIAYKDTVEKTELSDDDRYKIMRESYGDFASAAEGVEQFYTVESDKLKLIFTNKGGQLYSVELKEFSTYDKQPLILFKGETNKLGLNFFTNNRLIQTDKMFFEAVVADTEMIVNSDSGTDFAMRLYTADRTKYIEYLYHIPKDDYMVDFTIKTVDMTGIISANNGFIELDWAIDIRQQEKVAQSRLSGTNIYYRFLGDDKIDKLTESKDDTENLTVKTEWVSFKQQFFTTSLINKEAEGFISGTIASEEQPNKTTKVDRYIKTMKAKLTLPYYGQEPTTDYNMSMYFGPNKFKELKKYNLGLEDQINLGNFFLVKWINKLVIIKVFNLLERFKWNYGIIILILTVLIKLVLSPITYKTYLNGAKTRALKPEMDAIAAKYPNKEDAMKKNQAVMEMQRKFGVNPMSGCLPMLLQLPILIAMFRFFPGAFELRQESFLWAHDLSSYDSILDLPFKIPFYGDHVSLFALLMAVSTVIYTFINNKSMGQQSQPGMKLLPYIMPIMFLPLFNNYSSGLSYYYFLVNIITFAQIFVINRMIPQEKLRAKLIANAAKRKSQPKKKSKWQKRLEDMQRLQEQQARENAKRRR